ncbi:MAG: hypothetical protein SCALA702_01130 [Melioribacteraceae bacterium]|nr:MAG: hypothetical protein SCALA702_01130 [Melioribacteraceae bacterium]
MHNVLYCIVIKNPFKKMPIIFAGDKSSTFLVNDIDLLLSYKRIIAYDFHYCLETIRSKNRKLNSDIIDIKVIKKLLIGIPKKKLEDKKPWSLGNLINRYLDKKESIWLKRVYEFQSIDPLSDPLSVEIIKKVMTAFFQLYKDLVSQLKEQNELQRFFKVEYPVTNIFLKRELNGIKIAKSKLDDKIKELKKDYYRSLKQLEFKYDFSSHRIMLLNEWDDIRSYIGKSEFKDDFNYNIWETIEILREQEEFLELLYEAKYSGRDFKELLKYSVDKYVKIYPNFDVIGTVTARILITKPGIQYLKKENRKIFEPVKNKSFIYVDFDQFEPGILASLSKDKNLIEFYNKGDIYNQISEVLFNDMEHRRICKTLFLAYLYGMAKDRLLSLAKSSDEKIETRSFKNFFKLFEGSEKYRAKLLSDSRDNGFVDTYMGNRRYLRNKGSITQEEKRWVLSQKIQGTASLIFKRGIIAINQKYPELNIMVPMHDALLIEVEAESEEAYSQKVIRIMKEKYNEVCPEIDVRISLEEF